jgi:hypothetical protein
MPAFFCLSLCRVFGIGNGISTGDSVTGCKRFLAESYCRPASISALDHFAAHTTRLRVMK